MHSNSFLIFYSSDTKSENYRFILKQLLETQIPPGPSALLIQNSSKNTYQLQNFVQIPPQPSALLVPKVKIADSCKNNYQEQSCIQIRP